FAPFATTREVVDLRFEEVVGQIRVAVFLVRYEAQGPHAVEVICGQPPAGDRFTNGRPHACRATGCRACFAACSLARAGVVAAALRTGATTTRPSRRTCLAGSASHASQHGWRLSNFAPAPSANRARHP